MIRSLGRFACALTVLLAGSMPAQVASHILTSSEWAEATSRLSPKLIPRYGLLFDLEPKQSFAFAAPNGQNIWIVPVTYSANDPAAGKGVQTEQCGLFTLLPNGSTSFAAMYGMREQSWDENPAQVDCVRVSGVSFMPAQAGQPPFVLLAIERNEIYRPGVDQTSTKVFVCHWDAAVNAYTRDHEVEGKLTKGKGFDALPDTFTEAKRRLRSVMNLR